MREALQKTISKQADNESRNILHPLFQVSSVSRKFWAAITTTLFLILSITFYFVISSNPPKNKLTTESKTRTYPFVTSPYNDDFPTISPDGQRVAYGSDKSGDLDIWVRELGSSEAWNLTEDYSGADTEPA
ncbi:MAG: TolB family protein [bacterium]